MSSDRTPKEVEILTRAFELLGFASGYVAREERKEEFRVAALDLATLIPGATDDSHEEVKPLRESLEKIDMLAEAGLCQMTAGGKHAYLNDIRSAVAKLGIQGGLTEHE